jgi:hypothetical protein
LESTDGTVMSLLSSAIAKRDVGIAGGVPGLPRVRDVATEQGRVILGHEEPGARVRVGRLVAGGIYRLEDDGSTLDHEFLTLRPTYSHRQPEQQLLPIGSGPASRQWMPGTGAVP